MEKEFYDDPEIIRFFSRTNERHLNLNALLKECLSSENVKEHDASLTPLKESESELNDASIGG
jgi:hypothetical protein